MKINTTLSALLIASMLPLLIQAQELSPNAPQDKPTHLSSKEQLAALDKAIAPSIAKARASYPQAKARFLAGLPPQCHFFLTVRLHDRNGVVEQVFIAVESYDGENVTGTVDSTLMSVKEFKKGQKYTFREDEILDWLITQPDGSEEGNFVGKFLDTYKP